MLFSGVLLVGGWWSGVASSVGRQEKSPRERAGTPGREGISVRRPPADGGYRTLAAGHWPWLLVRWMFHVKHARLP